MSKPVPQIAFDHIHVFTSDPETSALWFSDALGAEIVRSAVRIEAKLGGLRIFFEPVSDSDGVGAAPASPHKGLDHFAFSVTDLDAVAAALKAKGIVFTKEPQTPRPGVRICFIEGPHGISIELLDRDPKYT